MMQPKPDIKFAQKAGLLMADLYLRKAKSKIGPTRNLTAIDASLNIVIVLLVGGFGTSPIGRELLVLLLQEAHSWLEEDGTSSYLSFAVQEAIYSLQIGQLPKFLPYTWSSYSYDHYAHILDPRKKEYKDITNAQPRYSYYDMPIPLAEVTVITSFKPYEGRNGQQKSVLVMPYVDTRTAEDLMGEMFIPASSLDED